MAETPINVTYPEAEDLNLRIALGACRFEAGPAEGDAWVTGACYDPTDRRPPRILEEGESVTITEVEPTFERLPVGTHISVWTDPGSEAVRAMIVDHLRG